MEQSSLRPKGMRTFLIVWLGQVISIVGSGMTGFALGVWLFEQTGKATPLAMTVLLGSLPRILLAPLAGSLADRHNRRRLMILADTGDALVTLGAVLLMWAGGLQVWHVYLIAPLSAAFAAFQEPAYTASITMLVAKEHLARANGLVQAAQALEMLVSPLLAAALFGIVGMRGIFAIDFLTYFLAVGALLLVHIPQPALTEGDAARPSHRRAVVWRDAVFGWQYLRARRGLLGMLFYFALVNFLLNLAGVLSSPMVLAFGSAATLGAVQTASGVGMLLGSVVMGAWGGPKRRVVAVIGFITLAAVGLALMGAAPSGLTTALGMGLLLFCVPMASGPSQAIFQSKVAPDVQGRVFAARSMISRAMMPVAFLIAGPLADHVFEPWMAAQGRLASVVGRLVGAEPGRGTAVIFLVAGALLAVASALAWANPRIRAVEDELPDAVVEQTVGVEVASATSGQ